jgi:hypothetical protein
MQHSADSTEVIEALQQKKHRRWLYLGCSVAARGVAGGRLPPFSLASILPHLPHFASVLR